MFHERMFLRCLIYIPYNVLIDAEICFQISKIRLKFLVASIFVIINVGKIFTNEIKL